MESACDSFDRAWLSELLTEWIKFIHGDIWYVYDISRVKGCYLQLKGIELIV